MSLFGAPPLVLAGLALAACAGPRGSGAIDSDRDGDARVEARVAPRDEEPASPAPLVAGDRVVVVELFSSEGCSSCPPADTLLAELSERERADGVRVVGLEHHVDYWDRLGWRDPFSSAASTERQSRYADARHGDSIFTPEAVVDGVASLVGSRRDALEQAVRQRRARPALPLRARLSRDAKTLHVELDAAPPEAAELVVAVTESGLSTAVPAGENAGSTLRHGPIVRWLRSAGPATKDAVDVSLEVDASGSMRSVVALVQARPQGEILGATVARRSD